MASGGGPPVPSRETDLPSTTSPPIPQLPAATSLQLSTAASALKKEVLHAEEVSAPRRLKRFVYLSSYDEFLCKFVREHDAHKVAYGEKIEAFKAVRRNFMKSVPARVFATHEKPSVKSVRIRYMRLEERRREAVRKTEPLLGNMETVSDLDVILDDLILEKDEFEENRRVEGDEQTAREQQLTMFEATIRMLAMSRKRRSTRVEDLTEDDIPRKNAKRSSTSMLEDVSTCMVESVERQKASEDKKIELEEQRFLFDKDRANKENERFQCTQDIAERKQSLEEKRFEMEAKYRAERSRIEREERQEAREERRTMIELMRFLMNSNR